MLELLAVVVPIKIASDTIQGTMANAGSNGGFMMLPSAHKQQLNSFPQQPVHTKEPRRHNYKDCQNGSFVNYEQPNIFLHSEAAFIVCPSCFATITTKVVYEKSADPPLCVCLFCGSNSIKDALHYCPSCHAFIGKFTP